MSKASEDRMQHDFDVIIKQTCDNLVIQLGSFADMTDWSKWVLYLVDRLDAFERDAERSAFDPTFGYVLHQIQGGIYERLESLDTAEPVDDGSPDFAVL